MNEYEKLIQSAKEKFNKKDYEGAIEDCDKAIKINSKDYKAYNIRGAAKLELKDYDEAIADFDKAIEFNPKDSSNYYNRGLAKLKLKDYKSAIVNFDEVINIDSHNNKAYNNRGVAKKELKDYEGAISDYDKAIELDPKDSNAYYNRGHAKVELKDYEGAIADYDKAIEIEPKNSSAYNNRGIAKEELKDYDGAIADYKKARSIEYKQLYLNNLNRAEKLKQEVEKEKINEDAQNDFVKEFEKLNDDRFECPKKEEQKNPQEKLKLIGWWIKKIFFSIICIFKKIIFFFPIFRAGYQNEERRWLIVIFVCVGFLVLFSLPLKGEFKGCFLENFYSLQDTRECCCCLENFCNLQNTKEIENFYQFFLENKIRFLLIFLLSFASVQYGRAKKLRIQIQNRIAVGKVWVGGLDKDEKKIFSEKIGNVLFSKLMAKESEGNNLVNKIDPTGNLGNGKG